MQVEFASGDGRSLGQNSDNRFSGASEASNRRNKYLNVHASVHDRWELQMSARRARCLLDSFSEEERIHPIIKPLVVRHVSDRRVAA